MPLPESHAETATEEISGLNGRTMNRKTAGLFSGQNKQFGNAAIFLTKSEVSAHMIPKMMIEKPQKMIVPQARIPAMQNLRDGGGTMKVMGNSTPKMATPTPMKNKK